MRWTDPTSIQPMPNFETLGSLPKFENELTLTNRDSTYVRSRSEVLLTPNRFNNLALIMRFGRP